MQTPRLEGRGFCGLASPRLRSSSNCLGQKKIMRPNLKIFLVQPHHLRAPAWLVSDLDQARHPVLDDFGHIGPRPEQLVHHLRFTDKVAGPMLPIRRRTGPVRCFALCRERERQRALPDPEGPRIGTPVSAVNHGGGVDGSPPQGRPRPPAAKAGNATTKRAPAPWRSARQ